MLYDNYISPEIQVSDFGSLQIICTSEYGGSPDKDFGWDWDDDQY